MTQVWDKKTWTQYAFFDKGGLVSFDNENAICAKVEYVIENNLGGFIIWELSGDLMDDLSTPLLDITNAKLNNPALNCGEPGLYPEEGSQTMPAFQVSATTARPTNPFGVQPKPVSFPTPPTTISTPDILYPTKPIVATPVTFPTPPTPVSSPEILNPDLYQPVNDQPVLFVCGDQEGTFNAADSKALDLSFRYELHRHPSVPVSEAMDDFKSSLLSGTAEMLKCSGASSTVRRLRNNPYEASQEAVKAIQSTQSDVLESDSESLILFHSHGRYCHLGNLLQSNTCLYCFSSLLNPSEPRF